MVFNKLFLQENHLGSKFVFLLLYSVYIVQKMKFFGYKII